MTRLLTYVEIDIRFCSKLYGTTNVAGTCAAILGTTGPIKCFNTRATCQDPENLSLGIETLRFAKDTGFNPPDIDAIPSLVDVQYSPATISLGKSLGERASVNFVFRDHPWGDTGPGLDKYRTERDYDPAQRGTFWGKLRARHRTLRSCHARLITGFLGQSIEEMETRHFIIDSIDGPNREGKFSVTAKDVLKLADGDKSKTPPLTNGFLSADLSAVATSFTAGFPPGFANTQYPTAAHYVSIGGNEIVRVTRSGNNFTVQSGGRGQFGTTAVAHSSGDRIQLCRYYEAKAPSHIFNDILTNDCGVSSEAIPISQWELEEATYLQRVYTRCIAEPMSSKTAMNELIEQAGLSLWPDDLSRQIPMRVIRGIPSDAITFEPGVNIIQGSLSVRDQPDTQITRCVTRFGLRHPLLNQSEAQSYRAVRSLGDGDAEFIFGSPAYREIAGTWIPPLGNTAADRANELQVGRFATPPRRFQFSIPRDGSLIPSMGLGARLRLPLINQDPTGGIEDVPIQVTRVRPDGHMYHLEAEEMLVKIFNPQDVINRRIPLDQEMANVNLLSVHNSLYPPLTAADVTNGVNLTVIIAESAFLYASSYTNFALTLPAGWPVGFPITIEFWGRIQGAGAPSVAAPSGTLRAGNPGLRGGTALRLRFPATLKFKTGSRLWSGGGSGGSGARANGGAGGTGGGGAGRVPGGSASYTSGDNGSNGTYYSVDNYNGNGGNGGDPGQQGTAGSSSRARIQNPSDPFSTIVVTYPGGAAGPAGYQIDGLSYATITENNGDRRGPTTG